MDNFQTLSESARDAWTLCRERKIKLAAAESCTGGLIANSIVSIAGASAFFMGSAVCYCDTAKERVLGVPREILDAKFAESPECCVAMLDGALQLYAGADAALATTGFFDSNTGDKPAELGGTVFVGAALRRCFAADGLESLSDFPTCGVRNSEFLSGAKIGACATIFCSGYRGDFLYLGAKLKLDSSAKRDFNMRSTVVAAFELLEIATNGI